LEHKNAYQHFYSVRQRFLYVRQKLEKNELDLQFVEIFQKIILLLHCFRKPQKGYLRVFEFNN